MRYFAWDAEGGRYAGEQIEARSAQEAAEAYVLGGDWEPGERTFWIPVDVEDVETGEIERLKVPVDPKEPPCVDRRGHDWDDRGSVIRGSGSGVMIATTCLRCGLVKIENTGAYDPVDGEQGLTSIAYELDTSTDYEEDSFIDYEED